MTTTEEFLRIAWIGCGATAVLDLWLLFLKRRGVATLDMALVGRWLGHLGRGRIAHPAIKAAAPIPGEAPLGWLTHYLIGIAFAALLPTFVAADWLQRPTLLPALLTGMATVVFPLFLMQPAMGLGIAARKTPTPLRNCLKSLLNHSVFGLGLFLAGTVVGIAYH